MANTSRVQGFVPVRHTDGSPWNGQAETFLVDSGDGTALFIGDAVKSAGGAGAAGQIVAGENTEGMATITRCSTGTAEQLFLGVIVGFSPDPTNLMLKHRSASTNRLARVVTDLSVIYEVQEDGVGQNLAAADVGMNGAFTTTAGSTTTGMSAMAADSNTFTTTATLPLKLVGFSRRVDNALGGSTTDLAKVEVLWNVGARMPNVVGA